MAEHESADEVTASTLTAIRQRALTASTYAEWHQVARDIETLADLLAAANERAETAEARAGHLAGARKAYDRMRAERDEARARLARVIGAVHHAFIASELCEPEPGDTMPTIASVWEFVQAIRDEAPDATATALSDTQTDAEHAQAREDANSSASAAQEPQEARQQ